MAITITDHDVWIKSTVPANRDENIRLFVRWFQPASPSSGQHKPVLMLHGRSVPALVWADLDTTVGDYSLAKQLADNGFDVFVMDLQGMGRSSHPTQMDDPCNVNPMLWSLVTPPLDPSCSPSYKKQLNNSDSDWHEIDGVIAWIKSVLSLPPGQKVALVGYSAAAYAVGPYAMHPTRSKDVDSLLLIAPIFPLLGRSTYSPPLLGDAISTPPAQFGFPMHVMDKIGFQNAWNAELDTVHCPDQRDDANHIVDVVWDAIKANDSVGAAWGIDGVTRVRNVYWWGWNPSIVSADRNLGTSVPVLIMYGGLDKTANNPASISGPLSVPDLYHSIRGPRKLMYRIDCASHSIVWEHQRQQLYDLSTDWLKTHNVGGKQTGIFSIDKNGNSAPATINPSPPLDSF